MSTRPERESLIGKDPASVPMSLQRILKFSGHGEHIWIGPSGATPLRERDQNAYDAAHLIIKHLAIQAPLKHKSGHPGGPLSAFTACYLLGKRRDPGVDQPLRMSAGHLSVLGYGLQWLFGREGDDPRLQSPRAIIDAYRTANGLPGHIEAGIGDMPFGTGPLGKGVSNALGAAYGLKYLKKQGIVDVLMADGDCQEGQVMEAVRLASHLGVDNLIVHGDMNDIQLSGMPSHTVAADFASIVLAAGWNVIEVQNGNDPAQVSAALDRADNLIGKGKPTFVCYYTTMGHGIELMERASNAYTQNFHGTPLSEEEAAEALRELPTLEEATAAYEPFRKEEQKSYASKPRVETAMAISWDLGKLTGYRRTITEKKGAARKDFGATHITNLMADDHRIVVLHADLAGSGGFDVSEKAFPDRVINVGVAEANMVMMAAGMRQAGVLPVTYTFAAFGTNEARANARLVDINTPRARCGVLHDCTHAGLSVGEDGETHQERNYLNIPLDHTQVWMTADSNQSAAMAERAMEVIADGRESIYVFFPRDGHEQLKSPSGEIIYDATYRFDGKADLLRGRGDTADRATIIATGITVHHAVAAADALREGADGMEVRVLNVSCVRPIDSSAVVQAALETAHIIVAEDHNTEGGLATIVADVLADFSLPCTLRRLGMNHYFPSAPAKDLYLIAGIDTESIIDAVQDEVRAEVRGGEDAFVTAIHELLRNLAHSKHAEKAAPFLRKLLSEKGYMDELRAHWARRECPKGRLPSNEELLEQLKGIS